MTIIYGVSWIEVEFGERDEGWSLYLDKEECIKDTLRASNVGAYEGGYCGPERPLRYAEIPLEYIEPEYINKILVEKRVHTKNNWFPKFKSQWFFIK